MQDTLVIIPTFNEKESITRIIEAVFSQEKKYDILVVDDNSPDNTSSLVKDLQGEYQDRLFLEIRAEKTGLGAAYIHGFKWALAKGYEYIIEMDADYSHNPDDLIKLYTACKENGADVAIGSRYINNEVNVVNWDMKRLLMSYFASKYVKFITRMTIADTTAGFVCYKRKVLETIQLDKINFIGYAFQIEMKFKAWKHKFNIKEVSVIFTDRTAGESKMHGRIISEAIFGVIKMKLKGLPKKP